MSSSRLDPRRNLLNIWHDDMPVVPSDKIFIDYNSRRIPLQNSARIKDVRQNDLVAYDLTALQEVRHRRKDPKAVAQGALHDRGISHRLRIEAHRRRSCWHSVAQALVGRRL